MTNTDPHRQGVVNTMLLGHQRLAWATALAWTLAVGLSLAWNIHQEREQIMGQAHAEARANYNKDITFRRWGNSHGGVYVPITDTQKSVPWLSHVPGRDVVTRDGQQLTLLNPASMLRQMMDRYTEEYGIRGRITGLRQLNPGNAPDPWETEQLRAFQRGEKTEVWAVANMDGKPYLRYLRAMYMEPGCDKCHGILGYKTGDMRGATGINLPLAPYFETLARAEWSLGGSHLAIWLIGMTGIGWTSGMRRARERERNRLLVSLEASEARFGQAMHGANDGIWDMDLEGGPGYQSPRVADMLGCAPTDIPARLADWRGLIHPEDHRETMTRFQAHLDGGSPRFEATFRVWHKAGVWRWILGRGQATRDADGRATRLVLVLTDITERKVMEARLHEEMERAQVTLASIGDAVLTTDADGRVTFMNGVAEKLTGWQVQAATGLPVEQVVVLLGEDTREPAVNPISRCRAEGRVVGLANHTLLIARDGREYAIDDSAAPILDRNGTLIGVVMVFRDVTETRELARQMRWQVTHDRLTGLVSRQEFEHRLETLVRGVREHGGQHALLFMDLDNFKTVNDNCGHLAGDELLRQLAFLLTESMRRNDTLGRLGGDEFGALLENCPPDKARDIAGKLLKSVGEFRFSWGDKTIDVGVSIGLAMVGPDTVSLAEALSAADAACYAAKKEGRGRIHMAMPGENPARHLEAHLAEDIRDALEHDRFVLFAQEIRPLGEPDAAPVRYEVLVRMLDRQAQLVYPGVFMPTAERLGLMPAVDLRVVRQALGRLARHSANPGLQLAINLAGQSLWDEQAGAALAREIAASGIDPGRLSFEITEAAAVSQLPRAIAFMRELKALGCRVALDDFGGGMASFAYLKSLPVDSLKIDGAFVRDMLDDPANLAIVEAIQKVATTLGMETVAEFVESEALLPVLKDMGIGRAQGYAVAKPRPLESLL
ncbi:MAG TPA: EAL domain-containing protein [Thiobacillaceae bacterium]|nr:EAL domain-containing protein [Thiobacillaceae bacterium]